MPRHFPHWLKAYCSFTAASEAPLDFHFWTGVSTIAACLRCKVWRDELIYRWTPNFYIIFVGPAGIVTKSTTLNIGYSLLRQVPKIHFGPDSMTWHGLAKRFEMAFEYFIWNNGGSDVKLPMSPLTCSISELGTFLRPDDKGLISFLTDVWDGKDRPFQHNTKDSGQITLENPWLNIVGATTPMWMQTNFHPTLLAEGIGSRILFVYADAKRHFTAYPSRVVKPQDYHRTEAQLIEDLVDIASLTGPFELTDEAYVWGEAWYNSPGRLTTSAALASNRYSGYLARKQTHLHKLAMILSVAQGNTLIITKDNLEEADKILKSTEVSMVRVFENVGVVDEAKHLAEVVAFVRAYGWITVHDLYYNNCHNIMQERDFKAAVRHAVDGGLIEVTVTNGVGGLSPRHRVVN